MIAFFQILLFKLRLWKPSAQYARKLLHPELLTLLATEAKDWQIREAAVTHIESQSLLAKIVKHDKHDNVKIAALNKIDDIEVALDAFQGSQAGLKAQIALIKRITDNNKLYEYATSFSDDLVKLTAIENITDESLLLSLAKSEQPLNLFKAIINRIDDPALLATLAPFVKKIYRSRGHEHRLDLLMQRLDDQTTLLELVQKAKHDIVRLTAAKYITTPALLEQLVRHLLKKPYLSSIDEDILEESRSKIDNQDLLKDIATYVPESGKIWTGTVPDVMGTNSPNDSSRSRKDVYIPKDLLLRFKTIRQIHKAELLNSIVLNDRNEVIRVAALARLIALLYQSPDDLPTLQESLIYIITEKEHSIPQHLRFRVNEIATTMAGQISHLLGEINDELFLFELGMTVKNPTLCNPVIGSISTQEFLEKITTESLCTECRIEALKKIYDKAFLAQVAESEDDESIRLTAIKKMSRYDESHQKAFERIARSEDSVALRKAAIWGLKDVKLIKELVLHDPSEDIRLAALKSAPEKNQYLFYEAALSDKDETVRTYALSKLSNQKLLVEFILKSSDQKMSFDALSKVHYPDPLAQIASHTKNEQIGLQAISKFKEQTLDWELKFELSSSIRENTIFDSIKGISVDINIEYFKFLREKRTYENEIIGKCKGCGSEIERRYNNRTRCPYCHTRWINR